LRRAMQPFERFAVITPVKVPPPSTVPSKLPVMLPVNPPGPVLYPPVMSNTARGEITDLTEARGRLKKRVRSSGNAGSGAGCWKVPTYRCAWTGATEVVVVERAVDDVTGSGPELLLPPQAAAANVAHRATSVAFDQ